EDHARLVQQPVALPEVARRTRGDDVLPDRLTASAARNDVVQRQAPCGRSAVHAGPAVTGEERATGDLPLHGAWNPDVVDEPDDVRPRKRRRGRAEWSIEFFDHLGLPLEDEHVGTP